MKWRSGRTERDEGRGGKDAFVGAVLLAEDVGLVLNVRECPEC
jgi:hypothetical protein